MLADWAFRAPLDDTKWEYLQENVFPLAEVWEGDGDGERFARLQSIARQLVRALEFLHARRVIHADVKPENVCFVHRRSRDAARPPASSPRAGPKAQRWENGAIKQVE